MATTETSEGWTPRKAALVTCLTCGIAALFGFAFWFRYVFLLLFMAVVLATALKPMVAWLNARRVPWTLAVVLIYLLPGLALVAGGFLWLPILADEAAGTIETMPARYSQFREQMTTSPNWLIARGGQLLPSGDEAFVGSSDNRSFWNQLWRWASEITPAAMRIVFAMVSVCLLSIYWLIQSDRTMQSLLLALPANKRAGAQQLVEQIEQKVGAYIRGQGILCVSIFVLSFLGYWMVGLPNALFLALIAGVLEAIPMIGPVLAAVPAILSAAADDPQKIVWVIVVSLIIQQIENYLLVPRVMDQSVGVNAVMTLLGMVAFGTLFGLLGAVLAIPLAAIVQLIFDRYVLSKAALDPPKMLGRNEVHRLRYQAQELMRDIRLLMRDGEEARPTAKDHFEERIEELARDLDRCLELSAEEASGDTPAVTGVLAT